MPSFANDPYLISVIALACALPLVWWLAKRGNVAERPDQPAERLDTLIGWPPESMRILRSSERLAFSTLKLALPGYMILAQVPLARFIAVPKRNSYAEWMRRLGGQCVDFVVCDVTSQVVAVVEIRPPSEQIDERLKPRLDRVARVLKAAKVPLHVWNETRLPTIENAREAILPNAPAIPADMLRRANAAETAVAAAAGVAVAGAVVAAGGGSVVEDAGAAVDPFADTDHDWTQSDGEVIEVHEPRVNTWYDELEEPVSAELPPAHTRR